MVVVAVVLVVVGVVVVVVEECEKPSFIVVAVVVVAIMEEDDSASSATQQQREEELKIVEKYVTGMITTFGTLPVDRIHSMLTAYLESYTLNMNDLATLLNKLVKQDKLDVNAGVFSIKK